MPQKVIFAFLILFFVWLMLTGFRTEEILLGAAVSALVAFISRGELIKGSVAPKFHPRRWVFSVIYVVIFLMSEIFSHLELAIRIIIGSADGKIFRLKSKFKNPVALTVLGNSITLTPGTLTLDVRGSTVTTYRLSRSSERVIKIFEAFLESVFR
ncbi:MAG: Na+/H+ antiporter subunit E [archaeon]|nr:MAG: Na+/H+ antiporter subunit E [archaeon]